MSLRSSFWLKLLLNNSNFRRAEKIDVFFPGNVVAVMGNPGSTTTIIQTFLFKGINMKCW